MFSYHHTIAKIQEYQMGRMLWLRGGGFEYKIKSNYNISVFPPMMTTTTFNLNDNSKYPYTVSPIVAVDSMFTSNILTDTLL
jgi:thiamine pyrophosphokinase